MANSEDMKQVAKALNTIYESISNMDKRAIETDEKINTLNELLVQEKQRNSDLENTLSKVKHELDEMEQKYDKLQKEYHQLGAKSVELAKDYRTNRALSEALAQEYKELSSSIILTREQINRDGRPKVLTDEEIEWIREQREQGRTLRSIAENLDVSHMTVSRALKTTDSSGELKQSNIFQRARNNDGN